MLLIHPPVVRNCEPPVALLRLAGALRAAGEEVRILDGAAEAFHWLTFRFEDSSSGSGNNGNKEQKRLARCVKNRERLWAGLTRPYRSFDRYKKQLSDLAYLARSAPQLRGAGLSYSPADLELPGQNPLNSIDLKRAWHHPEESPFYTWFEQRLNELLPEQPRGGSVGLSIGYLSQALTGMAMGGYIRRVRPDLRIQLGGSLISSWLKGPGDCSFFSELAEEVHGGPGEEAAVAFAGRSWKGPGIADPVNLFKLPYIAPGPILPYSASLGCSWKRCRFCNECWEDNPFLEEPAALVAEHLERLAEKHEPAMIHITDSEMTLPLLEALIIRPPEAPWYGFSRFFPRLCDPDFCRALARSGCRMLCLGLESGDQDVLNVLRKGINLDQVRIILRNLKEAGIGTFVYIMFGSTPETRDAALRTRDFILEHREYIGFLNVAVFSMPIMSGELSGLKSRSFYEGDLSLYRDFVHPAGWTRRRVREFLSREFKYIPEIREILKRTPPHFTSSHAPFFLP